jgi:predicted anti-sigma-YlaC factor YlaD
MSLFKRNCREVTALVLAGEDRKLGLLERWAVRAHLKVCQACPRFVAQVAFMHEALPRWRAYRDTSE